MKKNNLTAAVLLCLALPAISFGQSTYLAIEDTRDVSTLPTDYKRVIRPAFKKATSIGLNESAYYTIIGIRGWSDASGGPAHELAFSNAKGIFYRTGEAGWSQWRRVLSENVAGNVGIGTDTPKEKLSVNGKIRAHEIKVETANWPDYVFEEDYQLMPLDSLRQFITTHGHLPEIPTARQVEAEGISLGEMINKLLKKNEELTLHLIEKNRQIESLEQRVKALESKP